VDEKKLSKKQRKWLEASRNIGRGAMTKTERETLEHLYADMLPAEQQELERYIQEKYGKKDAEDNPPSGEEQPQDVIDIMERKTWNLPSDAIKGAFAKSLGPKKLKKREQS
jgi:hypothetical protein